MSSVKPKTASQWVSKGVYTPGVGWRGHGWHETYLTESTVRGRPKNMPPRDYLWLRAEFMCYRREQGDTFECIAEKTNCTRQNVQAMIERHKKELRSMAAKYGRFLTDIAGGNDMKARYQVHLVLYKVELDDEGNETGTSKLLEEEELAGYRDDFPTEESAREVFRAFSGIKEK